MSVFNDKLRMSDAIIKAVKIARKLQSPHLEALEKVKKAICEDILQSDVNEFHKLRKVKG